MPDRACYEYHRRSVSPPPSPEERHLDEHRDEPRGPVFAIRHYLETRCREYHGSRARRTGCTWSRRWCWCAEYHCAAP